jgi:hypothetical protein
MDAPYSVRLADRLVTRAARIGSSAFALPCAAADGEFFDTLPDPLYDAPHDPVNVNSPADDAGRTGADRDKRL